MKKLSGRAYKIIKTVHILSASIWIGAGVVALFLLTVILNKNNVSEMLPAIHYIDLLIIIPANLITFITGVIFSKFTEWGFFKHGWITLKYIINSLPVILGGVMLTPSILNMLSIVKKMGGEAIFDPYFIKSMNIFTGTFVVILVLLITAVCLTVIKPRMGRNVSK